MAQETRKLPIEIGWFRDSSMGWNSGLNEAGSASWQSPPRPPLQD